MNVNVDVNVSRLEGKHWVVFQYYTGYGVAVDAG